MTSLSDHMHTMTTNAAAYTAGWHAADLWHSGDDDAPTSPPREWDRARRAEWNRGFTDAEEIIERDGCL